MELPSFWTATALVVSILTVLLACVGLSHILSFTRYNLPIVPQGARGKDKDSRIVEESSTAQLSGDFAVFIIGVAVHRWLDVRAWWPVSTSFGRMMNELQAHPECGYLGGQSYFGNPMVSVQYWRSMDSLMEYARWRAPSKEHFPIWVNMRSHMRQNKSFGIFHETFKVNAGQYETIYINMPPFGLSGVVGKTKLHGRHQTAKGRAGLTSGDDHPAELPERPF